MAIPPLKMNKADVETAIRRTFKRNFKQLQFNKALSFSEVDSDGDNSFFKGNLMEKENTESVVV